MKSDFYFTKKGLKNGYCGTVECGKRTVNSAFLVHVTRGISGLCLGVII